MKHTGDESIRNRLLIVLAAVGGSLDAISYMRLDHVFTANMTGNTALLGLALARGDRQAVTHGLIALLAYVFGVGAGAWCVERRRGGACWPRETTRVLMFECMVLGVFALLASVNLDMSAALQINLLIAISALAMGLQSAAAWGLEIPAVVTTYISGTITSLTARMVRRASSLPNRRSQRGEHRSLLLAAIWGAYLLAALASGFANARWPAALACCPLLAVVVVATLAYRRWR